MTQIENILLVIFSFELTVTHQHLDLSMSPYKIAEDDVRLKSLQANTTLLKLLADPAKDNITKSEIFDMLHSRDGDFGENDLPTFPEDDLDSKADGFGNPNMQIDIVQTLGETVEKDSMSQQQKWDRPRALGGRVGVFRGRFSAIVIVLTVAVVLIAYIGMIVWRRIEIRNHKSRHFLLNNEESANEVRIEL